MKGIGLLTGYGRPFAVTLLSLVLSLSGCGGGGGGGSSAGPAPSSVSLSATGPNVQPVVVDAGPAGLASRIVNVLFTSVTVCMPGSTTQCQTVDHVMIDTGSTGLRLLSSALTLPLPNVTVNTNQPLLNCVQFLDASYLWGSVVTGDVSMSGEKAANLPLQLVGDPGFSSVPAACSAGGVAKNTVASLGANGVLGIGSHLQDCGSYCTSNFGNGFYYASTGSGPVGAIVSLNKQIQQPVSLFASDNNGAVIVLPVVSDHGAATVNGLLIFGIGTQTNNSPGAPSVLVPNNSGFFTTAFASQHLAQGFVDSGSNGLFFGDPSSPPYLLCSSGWYCPASTTALHAINTGANGIASQVNFSISNADGLFSNVSLTAFSTLAAPIGDTVSFDFGLPFFYGRNVYVAIQGKSTPAGVGPYVAYQDQ